MNASRSWRIVSALPAVLIHGLAGTKADCFGSHPKTASTRQAAAASQPSENPERGTSRTGENRSGWGAVTLGSTGVSLITARAEPMHRSRSWLGMGSYSVSAANASARAAAAPSNSPDECSRLSRKSASSSACC